MVANIIIGLILAVLFALAVRHIVKKHRNGDCCDCGCGCGKNCHCTTKQE